MSPYIKISPLVGLVILTFITSFSSKVYGQVTSFPYYEDFEQGFGEWINYASDDFDWSRNLGSTPSNNTGPDGASSGESYIYIESSTPNNPSKYAYLDATFDFTGIPDPLLTFHYHMFGADMGTLSVDIYDGSWNLDVFTISGQQHSANSDDFTEVSLDMSAYGDQSDIIVSFAGISGSGYRSDIAIDDISITIPCTVTPGTASINNTSLCAPGAVDLTLTGQDGGTVIQWQESTDNITYSDISGASTSPYTTSSLASGIHYFRAEVSTTCPSYSNVVSVNVASGSPSPIPYSEDFESNFGNWSNSSDDTNEWIRQTGSTPSGGTGPSSASSNSYYLFVESSDPNFNSSAKLVGDFDLDGSTNPELSFDYHMFGGDMGSLIVYANGDIIFSISEQQHGSEGATWTTETIDLSSYISECNVRIEFEGNTGPNFESDIAIDKIEFTDNCSVTPGTSSTSQAETCPGTTVDLSLTGHDGGTSIQWQYSTDGIYFSNIAGATSASSTSPVLSSGTTYYFRAAVTNSCTSYSSISTTTVFEASSAVGSFPYYETFESDLGNFTNELITDDNDWIRQSGSTPSADTGPNEASEGNFYVFIESSDPNFSSTAEANLLVDFSGLTNPEMQFDYHMFGADHGELEVFAITSSGTTTLFSVSGQQHGATSTPWTTATIDLSAFTGECNLTIQFTGSTGTNYRSDIAIDNIIISENCIAVTPGTVSSDVNTLCGSGTVNLNLTGNSVGSIQWQSSTDNSIYSDISGATSATVTTPSLTEGTHYFRAQVTNGCSATSDSLIVIVHDYADVVSDFPYFESFESGLNMWNNLATNTLDWTENTGGTASNNTGPSGASDGSEYIYTEASGTGSPDRTAVIQAIFDFTYLSTPTLSYDYHMYGAEMGNLDVQIFSSGIWTSLETISGQQQSADSDPWTTSTIDLTAYGGDCGVIIQFTGTTGADFQSDIALDNIIVSSSTFEWLGTTNSSWNLTSNWNVGIPTVGANVIIHDQSNDPLISATSPSVGDLNIQSGAELTISNDQSVTITGELTISGELTSSDGSSSTINIEGDWVNNGTFNAGESTVIFNGALAQEIRGAQSSTFFTLEIDNPTSATLNINTNIESLVTLEENSQFDVNGFDLLLLSTSSRSAYLGAVPSSATFTGEISVERYIPNSSRQWRNIAPPVTGLTVSDWQTHVPITGTFTGSSVCSGCKNNASMYRYNESVGGSINNGWEAHPITSNSEFLTSGEGYSVYFRDDTSSFVTITSTGSPIIANSSPFEFDLSFTNSTNLDDGWNLLGNPFPAPIDWDSPIGWTKNNLNDAVYFTSNELGSTVSYVAGISNPFGLFNGTIPIGQAFWVNTNIALPGTPVLEATEDVKSSSDPDELFYRNQPNLSSIINIELTTSESSDRDYAIVHFNDHASSDFDNDQDAHEVDFTSKNLSISTISEDNQILSINGMPHLHSNESTMIPLSVKYDENGIYTIYITNIEAFDSDITVTLFDVYQGIFHDFLLEGEYSFTISNDASKDSDRFILNLNKSNEVITDLKEISNSTVSVYPNPVSEGNLNVFVNNQENCTLQLVNVLGEISLGPVNLENGTNEIDIDHLHEGVYTYHIEFQEHTTAGQLVITKK